MNYHNITYPDQNNGDGLRVVLWVSGCEHCCKKCQNPQTWEYSSGIQFDQSAKEEILNQLKLPYIEGITLSGGDPLAAENVSEVYKIVDEIRLSFPSKTIWLYTGYTLEQLYSPISGQLPRAAYKNENDVYKLRQKVISACDVVVDGEYIDELRDVTLHWCGSSNQRVIDVKKTFEKGEVVLWHS